MRQYNENRVKVSVVDLTFSIFILYSFILSMYKSIAKRKVRKTCATRFLCRLTRPHIGITLVGGGGEPSVTLSS